MWGTLEWGRGLSELKTSKGEAVPNKKPDRLSPESGFSQPGWEADCRTGKVSSPHSTRFGEGCSWNAIPQNTFFCGG